MQLSRIGRRVGRIAFSIVVLAARSVAQEFTERVSVNSTGVEGNDWSAGEAISADARIISFQSNATNLVAGDANGTRDVFVRDRATGIIERVSVTSSGAEADSYSFTYIGSISSDGQIVTFTSWADNLVAGDTNGHLDVFVHDRATGITERVSVDSSGAEGDLDSYDGVISADGQTVAFQSYATNLVANDQNGVEDVFVHDRSTGVTTRISLDTSGTRGGNGDSFSPSISADGQVVAFTSVADNLVVGDANGSFDVFVRDRVTGITERASVDSSGAEGDMTSGYYYGVALSADGQVAAFGSFADNLVAGDSNWAYDVFAHDRTTGLTERVSVDSSGAEADFGSWVASISVDGQIVAFTSSADNLVAGDTNGFDDVFVHDRATGVTRRVSVDSLTVEGNNPSDGGALSADGTVVAFDSFASNLVAADSNGSTDVFVHESCDVVASWSNYGDGFPGTNGVPAFTAEGNPVLGKSLKLDLANSAGSFTVGVLFIGAQRATIHSSWSGDLLVVPEITIVIGVPTYGASFIGGIPFDMAACGATIDLQAIELDPGAAKGVSFTQGLELLPGD